MSTRLIVERIYTLHEKCKHLQMNSIPPQEHGTVQQRRRALETLTTNGWASKAALGVVFFLMLLALALLLIGYLTDWSQIEVAFSMVLHLMGLQW